MIASLFKSQTFFLPTEFVDKADLPLFVDDPWERKMMLWARRLFQRDVLKYIWETLFGNKFVRTHTLTNLVSYHFHGNNADWQNTQSQSVCTVSDSNRALVRKQHLVKTLESSNKQEEIVTSRSMALASSIPCDHFHGYSASTTPLKKFDLCTYCKYGLYQQRKAILLLYSLYWFLEWNKQHQQNTIFIVELYLF